MSLFKFAVLQRLAKLTHLMESIVATQAELVTTLNAINTSLTKIGTETTALLAKVDELKVIIAAGGVVTPELQAAVDAVAAQAKMVDDLVPDPTPVP